MGIKFKFTLIAVLTFFLFNSYAFAITPIRVVEGTVTKVSDGDTIHVTDNLGKKVKVRFYGIDCPETEKSNKKTGKVSKPGQPYGEEAFQALRDKIFLKHVRLDITEIDKYKRSVSLVWLGNRNINQEMISEGWAWAYRDYLDSPYASEFIRLEEQAREKRLGLWQQANPEPPWEFRHKLKAKGKKRR